MQLNHKNTISEYNETNCEIFAKLILILKVSSV